MTTQPTTEQVLAEHSDLVADLLAASEALIEGWDRTAGIVLLKYDRHQRCAFYDLAAHLGHVQYEIASALHYSEPGENGWPTDTIDTEEEALDDEVNDATTRLLRAEQRNAILIPIMERYGCQTVGEALDLIKNDPEVAALAKSLGDEVAALVEHLRCYEVRQRNEGDKP